MMLMHFKGIDSIYPIPNSVISILVQISIPTAQQYLTKGVARIIKHSYAMVCLADWIANSLNLTYMESWYGFKATFQKYSENHSFEPIFVAILKNSCLWLTLWSILHVVTFLFHRTLAELQCEQFYCDGRLSVWWRKFKK